MTSILAILGFIGAAGAVLFVAELLFSPTTPPHERDEEQ